MAKENGTQNITKVIAKFSLIERRLNRRLKLAVNDINSKKIVVNF